MSKTRTILAAIAVVPVMAMVLSTNALADTDDGSSSRSVQQTSTWSGGDSGAGPSNLDEYTNEKNLFVNYTFDNVVDGQTGSLNDQTGNAVAAVRGKTSTAVGETGESGDRSLVLGSGDWLDLKKTGDQSPLLAGRHAITISYDSRSTQNKEGWSVFAARDGNAQIYNREHYLGVMDQTGTVKVERYNNDGSRNTEANVSAPSTGAWKHIDIIITDDFSALYVNGVEESISTKTSGRSLPEILGGTGGVLQIGKGNWGSGEYFTGDIDNLKIYDSTDAAIRDGLAAMIPRSIDSDFTLPLELNGVPVSWSSETDALSINQRTGAVSVIRPSSDQPDASAKLTASWGDSGASAEFSVTVSHQESNRDKASADLNAIEIPDSSDIRSSITLPLKGSLFGTTLTWTSSDPDVISDTTRNGIAAGVVSRSAERDKTVVLTATAVNTGLTRRFVLTVKKNVKQVTTTDYLFAHFTGTEESATDEQIYFATSQNGLQWTDTHTAGTPALTSDVGEHGVRDPYLVRSPEGDRFYLIATDLSIYHRGGWGKAKATTTGSKNLVVWESDDLVHWSDPRLVDVASRIPDAGMAWAPEAYWDPAKGQYMVYWATSSDSDNTNGDPTNMYYSTTRDFRTFTDPVKWIDRKQSVIDTTMIKADDGYYYRVSGDTYLGVERSKNPYAVVNDNSGDYNRGTDPNQWTLVGDFKDLVGNSKWTGTYLEGPELFRYNTDDIKNNSTGRPMEYGLMWDQYKEGKGYLPFRSADLGSTNLADWQAASDVNFGSLKKRHGTILPITADEFKAINAAYSGNKVPDKATIDEVPSVTVLDSNNSEVTDTSIKVGQKLTLVAVVNDPVVDDRIVWTPENRGVVSVESEEPSSSSTLRNDVVNFTGLKKGTTKVKVTVGAKASAEFTIHVLDDGSTPQSPDSDGSNTGKAPSPNTVSRGTKKDGHSSGVLGATGIDVLWVTAAMISLSVAGAVCVIASRRRQL